MTISTDWDWVGNQVKRRRKDLDLSTGAAARRASVSEGTWKDVEDGECANLSTHTLVRVAQALNIDAEAFRQRCGGVAEASSDEGGEKTASDWYALGEHVHRRRESLDLSVGDAAKRASVSKGTLEDVEDGYGSDLNTAALTRIALALGFDPNAFLKRCGRQPPAVAAITTELLEEARKLAQGASERISAVEAELVAVREELGAERARADEAEQALAVLEKKLAAAGQ